jgi:hypothetical protein
MLQATLKPTKPKLKSKPLRFPGICAAAKELQVERTHLYRVLSGQRESRRLKEAYRKLKSA